MMLSGLEPVLVDSSSLFVNIGERTNVTGSKAFARMILNGEFEQALADLGEGPKRSGDVADRLGVRPLQHRLNVARARRALPAAERSLVVDSSCNNT